MKITPLKMAILLASYTGCKAFDHYADSKTYRDQKDELLERDYIILRFTDDRPMNTDLYEFKITDKGKTWIETALATKEPVQMMRWEVLK